MRIRIGLLLALVCLTVPLLAQEQEATIQFSGEKAETIASFSFGLTATAGKAAFNDLTFTKPVTALSSTLFLGCATGKHFPSAVIAVAKKKGKDKGTDYIEIKLTDILVSSYRVSGDGNGTADTTSLTFANADYTLTNP